MTDTNIALNEICDAAQALNAVLASHAFTLAIEALRASGDGVRAEYLEQEAADARANLLAMRREYGFCA